MKNVCKLLICFLGMALISCGGKEEKKINETPSFGDVKEYSEKMQEGVKKSNDRWKERKEKGDTMAMPYKDLQAYLPDISGYEKSGGPKGSQMNTPMGSWSQAEQEYTSGDKKIEVTIVDYNSAYQAFTGLTAAYGMGFSFEDDTKKQAPLDLGKEGVAGYETIYKDGSRGELVMVVAERFIVNIKTDKEASEDALKKVANEMPLNEMANK